MQILERILGWVDGFTTASRLFHNQAQSGWFTSATIPAWASFAAAFLAAIAALASANSAQKANKASASQAISARRLEILRVSSENIAELLIARDRFASDIQKAKEILAENEETGLAVRQNLDELVEETQSLVSTMIAANNAVIDGVFKLTNNRFEEWDDYVRSALKKRQEISHVKSAFELKSRRIMENATRLYPS